MTPRNPEVCEVAAWVREQIDRSDGGSSAEWGGGLLSRQDRFDRVVSNLLRTANTKVGTPGKSHHRWLAWPVGLVRGMYRLLGQPFISETLESQTVYNGRVVEALEALHERERALQTEVHELRSRVTALELRAQSRGEPGGKES